MLLCSWFALWRTQGSLSSKFRRHGSSVAGLLCSTTRAHGDANDLASQAPCTTTTILMLSFPSVCKSSFVLTFSFRTQVSFSCPTPTSMHHTLCSTLVFACIGACPLRKLLATMPSFVQTVPEPSSALWHPRDFQVLQAVADHTS